jgi:hypothetical protein
MDSNVLTFATLIVSCLTGLAVVYNSDTQAKSFRANIILNLADSFSSQGMNDAMKNLKDNEEHIKTIDHEVFQNTIYDQNRRKVTHHFFKMYLLKRNNIIDDKILKTVAQKEDVQFLVEHIEPMEQKINKDYNREMFDFYHNLLNSDFYLS